MKIIKYSIILLFSSVNIDLVKNINCSILSSYMEWYFSFMYKAKVKG